MSGRLFYRKWCLENLSTGMTGLAGEVIYEAVKFIIMLLLLAGGVVIGGKLRTRSHQTSFPKNKGVAR